jgi:cytochrome b
VSSRSRARARAQVSETEEQDLPQRPRSLAGAAAVQGVETVGVFAASVLAGVDAASGQSYHTNSGIALTLIGVFTALLLGWVAIGVARIRAWSRTPALITQLFVGIVSIYLIQASRYEWGLPGLALALAGFVTLLVPASTRALARGSLAPSTDRRG